jgi:lysophospholipase L1-like esterase
MSLRNPLAFIPLFVLLLISATRAADAPFEKDIRAFEAADRKQAPPKDAVLFIGSSTIRFWTSLPTDFPELKVINRGFGGSQIADSVRYADRIAIPYHPSHIVMYAGDNDLAAGKTPQQVLADFQAFVDKIHGSLPDVPITFISIKPSLARWKLVDKIKEANALVEQYATTAKHVDFVDIFPALLGPDGKPRKELFRPDGLHMSPKGYAIVVSILKPKLDAKQD